MRRVAVIALLFVACSTWVSDTLYFGTDIPAGGIVTDEQWEQFEREVIAPRFEGYTHHVAVGVWKGDTERTHVVHFLQPRADEKPIREIAAEYKKRFGQESVLWVRGRVRVSFE